MRLGLVMSALMWLFSSLAPRADAAATTRLGDRVRASSLQVYNPADYLKAKVSPAHGEGAEVAFQAPSLAQVTGVVCSADPANAPAPPVKGCAPGDPSCVNQFVRAANSAGARNTAPSGAEIAEQLVGLLKDNCRPASGEGKPGFGPAIGVNVVQPGGDVPVRKRQVSASVGINGSF